MIGNLFQQLYNLVDSVIVGQFVGAGVATVISQFVSGISCRIYAICRNEYFKMNRNDLKFDMVISGKVLMTLGRGYRTKNLIVSKESVCAANAVTVRGTIMEPRFLMWFSCKKI